MKKLFFLAFFFTNIFLKAQSQHITFETGNLSAVLEKAQKENKLVFIDAYTSWCGPCKEMAKNVFTDDSVAAYFNSRFINYKMDMEKGRGVDFAESYNINCYPSFLFVDGQGNIIHRGAGYMKPAALLDFAGACLSPVNSFASQKNKFEKDGLNEKNVLSYIKLMENACQSPSDKIISYVATVKEPELQKRIHWILIRDYVIKYDSREINYFLKNITAYENKYGKDSVEEKLQELGRNYFANYIYSDDVNKAAFDQAKKEFKKLGWPYAEKIVFRAELNFNKRFNKQKYYDLAAAQYLLYNNNNASALNGMAWDFIEGTANPDHLNAALAMEKRACEIRDEYSYLDTYALLLYKNKNFSEAETLALAAIEKAKLTNLGEEEFAGTTELLKKIRIKLRSK